MPPRGNTNNNNPGGMSVDQLIAMATHAQDTGHVDAACNFYEVALQKMPHHIDVLEAYAEVLLHYKNQPDRARQMLQHAIEVSPNQGYVKFLNLAQLSKGHEALKLYEAAVNILKREMGGCNPKLKKGFRKRNRLAWEAATATVAAAELFLTDLCDEPEAERRCDMLLQEAIGYCPTNIEAHQVLGSFRISQQRPDEARTALLQAVKLSKHAPETQQPSFDSKIELLRLLMQVDAKAAFEFGLVVLNIDDTCALTWFLLAETARMRGRFVDSARLFRRARITAIHCQQQHAVDDIDQGIRALVNDMGGDPNCLNQVEDIDNPDPISLLQPEDDENNNGNSNSNKNKNVDDDGADWESDNDDDEEEPVAFPEDDMNDEDDDDDDNNNGNQQQQPDQAVSEN